jgi:proteasome lid subunit RPN8/RPN11/LysM repeat protein
MGTESVTFSTRRFLLGKAGPFPRLVFREEVMLALDQFSHLHSQGEHGGFLVGRKKDIKTAEQYEIMVERFVPIPQRSDATRLVIHPDHNKTVELALKAGEEIVGWAHTHPGFGVFLSNFDKEQHQRFFPLPWQVAYVMDTQAQERVAYRLVEGEWKRLEGYYVLRDMANNEVGVTSQNRSGPWLRIVVAVLTLALLVAGVTMGVPVIRDLLHKPEQSDQQVSSPEHGVGVANLPAQAGSESAPVVPPQSAPETGAEEAAAVTPSTISIAPPSSVPRYIEYVVQRGDTLWSIAGDLWGDSSLFRLIAEENDISNPASIGVGTVLRVPVDARER